MLLAAREGHGSAGLVVEIEFEGGVPDLSKGCLRLAIAKIECVTIKASNRNTIGIAITLKSPPGKIRHPQAMKRMSCRIQLGDLTRFGSESERLVDLSGSCTTAVKRKPEGI